MKNTPELEMLLDEGLASLARLESRVEELEAHEDLRDFEKAVAENGSKSLVPWEKARAMFELD